MKKALVALLAFAAAFAFSACEATSADENSAAQLPSYTTSENGVESSEVASSVSSESPEEQVKEYCNIKNCGKETKIPSKVYEIFAENSIITSAENVKYYPNKSDPSSASDCSFTIGNHNFVAKGYVRKAYNISMSDDADSDLNGYEYTLNSVQSADGKKIWLCQEKFAI